MGERFSGYEDVANTELARRRTYEKTSAAYAVSGDRGIVEQAKTFVKKNRGSKDPLTQGKVDGYKEFLRNVA